MNNFVETYKNIVNSIEPKENNICKISIADFNDVMNSLQWYYQTYNDENSLRVFKNLHRSMFTNLDDSNNVAFKLKERDLCQIKNSVYKYLENNKAGIPYIDYTKELLSKRYEYAVDVYED